MRANADDNPALAVPTVIPDAAELVKWASSWSSTRSAALPSDREFVGHRGRAGFQVTVIRLPHLDVLPLWPGAGHGVPSQLSTLGRPIGGSLARAVTITYSMPSRRRGSSPRVILVGRPSGTVWIVGRKPRGAGVQAGLAGVAAERVESGSDHGAGLVLPRDQ